MSEFPADELEELIVSGSIRLENLPSERVKLLDPAGSCFLALKAADNGLDDAAVILARHSWNGSSGLIREKAAEICISSLMKQQKLADAEFFASLAAAEYPENYYFRRTVIEAKYWQKEDRGLTEDVTGLLSREESSGDFELYLFRAVSAYREQRRGWQEYWIVFFENVPASDFIKRGWDFLDISSGDAKSEFPFYEDLFFGKYLFSSGEYFKALEPLKRFFAASIEGGVPGFDTDVLSSDLEDLFVRTGESLTGARFFEEQFEKAGKYTDSGACLLFAAARLYRRAGYYRDAGRCLDDYREYGGEITDRVLWYMFDLLIKISPKQAATELTYYTEKWENPCYFTDILDNLCTALARQLSWKELAEAAVVLSESGPAEAADRFRYIADRAAELGYIQKPDIAGQYSDIYYSILSGEWSPPVPEEVDTENNYQTDLTAATFMDGPAAWIAGLADFELEYRLLPEIEKYRLELPEQTFIMAAEAAAGAGNWLDSIRIMYQYPEELSFTGMKHIYPDAYRDEIETAAEMNGHPPFLLFGIVWKESGFERDIVSRSGAVGLSQLMPSTADDIAGRMGVRVKDLTDPAENLAFGSWYLNWLQSYIGNTAYAVISYNGGPGRVRRWLRDYPGLPDDLFYETVPVAETHWYGKRVLTATVLYGWFYYNIAPEDSLEIFFPELRAE